MNYLWWNFCINNIIDIYTPYFYIITSTSIFPTCVPHLSPQHIHLVLYTFSFSLYLHFKKFLVSQNFFFVVFVHVRDSVHGGPTLQVTSQVTFQVQWPYHMQSFTLTYHITK